MINDNSLPLNTFNPSVGQLVISRVAPLHVTQSANSEQKLNQPRGEGSLSGEADSTADHELTFSKKVVQLIHAQCLEFLLGLIVL